MGLRRTKRSGDDRDEKFMRECFRLALLGGGRVGPNPLVGAVLVRGGRIVSRGYHRRFGGAHAEVECLQHFRGDPSGATLYVNLEPCAHHGKTPPCTDLIRASRVTKVVVAMKDPNPLVRGRGIRSLRRAGITVRTGILHDEAQTLNRRFVVGITRRRPYVHLKLAQSLDGYLSRAAGHETRITGRPARALVHRWRSIYDAVLVGAGTLTADDPELTVRLVRGRDPDVVIVDGDLSVSPGARVFKTARRRRVFVVTGKVFSRGARARRLLEEKGVRIVEIPVAGSRLPMGRVLKELYRLDVGSLLVEGGADIAGQFLDRRLVDRLSVFVAPVVFGRGVKGFAADRTRDVLAAFRMHVEQVGKDVLLAFDR